MLFCIDLKKCSFIIAYLLLVCKSIMLFFFVFNVMVIVIILSESSQNYLKIVATIESGRALILFLDIASTVILIIGLHKNNRKLVHAFLVTTVTYFILSAILFVWGISISVGEYTKNDWFHSASQFIFKCANMYCIYVITMYYTKMSKREEGCCAYDNLAHISTPDDVPT